MFDDAVGGPQMAPAAGRVLVALFDGQCAVCSRSARWIGARDRERRVERLDLRADATATRFPGFSPEAVRAQMHVVTREGRVLIGIDGVRAVLAELPRWSALAAVIGVPGVYQLSGLVYRWFARNRLTFNRWIPLPEGEQPCTDACAVDWAALERAAAASSPPEESR